ncbi:MAG: MBOAT family protein [Lachnospiraceae bacterium]|nr:MBOAT family protein [Lachnospiraceae bacterium]
MVFSSLLFLFRFLPIALFVYVITPKKFKNFVLFLASLIFYAWGEPQYVVLMIFSTVVDFVHGDLVYRCKEKGNLKAAKCFVASSAIMNLGLLGYFKYSGLLVESLGAVLNKDFDIPDIALPIGISFYTFQTMSYTIDIYRGKCKPQKNIIDFGTYVALFPQLIAGPIVSYHQIDQELRERKMTTKEFYEGILCFMAGLSKKVLLANNAGLLFDQVKALGSSQSVVAAWMGIFAYSFQIYFDFSGYSDMAVGLGKMLGFHFPKNFDYPYISKSITEFWRRWHITLSSWFRDYVYIPLGGNRKGLLKQIRNIAIVWILTGIWHGASYNYVLWGVYFGCLLILEKICLKKWLDRIPAVFSHLYSVFFILIGWLIFSFEAMGEGMAYAKVMFGMADVAFANDMVFYLLRNYGVLLVASVIGCTPLVKKWVKACLDSKKYQGLVTVAVNAAIILLFVIITAYLVDASYNPFLYFRF